MGLHFLKQSVYQPEEDCCCDVDKSSIQCHSHHQRALALSESMIFNSESGIYSMNTITSASDHLYSAIYLPENMLPTLILRSYLAAFGQWPVLL